MYIDELNNGYLYEDLWRNDKPRSIKQSHMPISAGKVIRGDGQLSGSNPLSMINPNKLIQQGEAMNNITTSIPSMGAILEADEQGVTVTAVKTAMELDIFEVIAEGHHTVEDIARVTNCNLRALNILLDVLCVKGLLGKVDNAYQLTPTSETYLIRSGRGYCIPLYLAWLQAREHFTEFVRTGKPTLNLMAPESEDLWVSYAAAERVRLPELVELATKRWTSVGLIPLPMRNASILDIGSGSGFKSFSLLPGNPDAHITAVDSPKVLEITRDVAEAMGVSHQVTLQSGDVLSEVPAERFDMVIFGNLLHYFDAGTATNILRKAYRALRPEGLAVIYAKGIQDRATDTALLSNIDISNCGPHGGHYTAAEYMGLFQGAGFEDVYHTEPVVTRGTKKS
jgi:SAM-dependent methyltransferase